MFHAGTSDANGEQSRGLRYTRASHWCRAVSPLPLAGRGWVARTLLTLAGPCCVCHHACRRLQGRWCRTGAASWALPPPGRPSQRRVRPPLLLCCSPPVVCRDVSLRFRSCPSLSRARRRRRLRRRTRGWMRSSGRGASAAGTSHTGQSRERRRALRDELLGSSVRRAPQMLTPHSHQFGIRDM